VQTGPKAVTRNAGPPAVRPLARGASPVRRRAVRIRRACQRRQCLGDRDLSVRHWLRLRHGRCKLVVSQWHKHLPVGSSLRRGLNDGPGGRDMRAVRGGDIQEWYRLGTVHIMPQECPRPASQHLGVGLPVCCGLQQRERHRVYGVRGGRVQEHKRLRRVFSVRGGHVFRNHRRRFQYGVHELSESFIFAPREQPSVELHLRGGLRGARRRSMRGVPRRHIQAFGWLGPVRKLRARQIFIESRADRVHRVPGRSDVFSRRQRRRRVMPVSARFLAPHQRLDGERAGWLSRECRLHGRHRFPRTI
jgi:hypothetical protein